MILARPRTLNAIDLPLARGLRDLVESLPSRGLRVIVLRGEGVSLAVVQGSAAGAGLGLACAADFVVAGASARFAPAYAAVGRSPDAGRRRFLPRLVGTGRAAELLLRNRILSALEARDWGIVTEVVADEDLEARAGEIVAQICAGPGVALAQTKRLLRGTWAPTLEGQLSQEGEAIVTRGGGVDAAEGVAAFLDRLAPGVQG